MSDIRFNRWLHQSGTGGVYQDGSGRVGIGTSLPTSTLDIVGTVNATTLNVNVGGSSSLTTLNVSGISTLNQLKVGTGGTIITTTTSGLVGIGTTNPSSILDVRQTQVGNPSINLTNSSTDAGSYASYYINAGNVTGQFYCDAQGNAGLQGLTIKTTTNHGLRLETNNVERMRLDTSGNLLFNSGYGSAAIAYGCRAWVRFNGTGSNSANQTINGSGNVSTVFKNATGDYTVNFTNAFVDANYSVTHAAGIQSVQWGIHLRHNSVAPSTTAYRFKNVNPSDGDVDVGFINLAFHR